MDSRIVLKRVDKKEAELAVTQHRNAVQTLQIKHSPSSPTAAAGEELQTQTRFAVAERTS
jgi:hypothetical protein